MAKKSTRKKESLYGAPVTSGAFKGGVSVRGIAMPKPVQELLSDLEGVKSKYESLETAVTNEEIVHIYKGSYIDSTGNTKGIVSFDDLRDSVQDAVEGEASAIRAKINELNNKFDEARLKLDDDVSSQLLFIYFVKGIGFSGDANFKTDFTVGLSDSSDKDELDAFHDAYNDVIIDIKKSLTQKENTKIKKIAENLCNEFLEMTVDIKSCRIFDIIPDLYSPGQFSDNYDFEENDEGAMNAICDNLISVSSKRCNGDPLECTVVIDAEAVDREMGKTLEEINERHTDDVDFVEVRDSVIFINGENFSVTSFESDGNSIVSTLSLMNAISRYGASQEQAKDFILDHFDEISSKCELTIHDYDRVSRKYVTHDFIKERMKEKEEKKELEKAYEQEKSRELEEKERLERIYEEAYAREAERLQRAHQQSYVRPELPQYRVVSYEDERPEAQEQIPISPQARSEEPRHIEQPEVQRDQSHEKQSSVKKAWDVAKASARELEDLLAKSRERSLRKEFQRGFRKTESSEPRRRERGTEL